MRYAAYHMLHKEFRILRAKRLWFVGQIMIEKCDMSRTADVQQRVRPFYARFIYSCHINNYYLSQKPYLMAHVHS